LVSGAYSSNEPSLPFDTLLEVVNRKKERIMNRTPSKSEGESQAFREAEDFVLCLMGSLSSIFGLLDGLVMFGELMYECGPKTPQIHEALRAMGEKLGTV